MMGGFYDFLLFALGPSLLFQCSSYFFNQEYEHNVISQNQNKEPFLNYMGMFILLLDSKLK